MTDDLKATMRVMAYVNHRHSLQYSLVRRLGGRVNGAYLLRAPDAPDAVLKWNPQRAWAGQIQRAAVLIAQARQVGWPTPAWLAVGRTPGGYPYQVQAFAAGTAATGVDPASVRAILPVLERQRGLAPDTPHDWAGYDHRVVTDPDFARTGQVATFSPAGAELHRRLLAWVEPFLDRPLSASDLVHGDLNPANVLWQGNHVGALVDAEMLGRGTVLHDVATLIMYAGLTPGPAAVPLLLDYAARVGRPGELALALSASVLNDLVFQLEHGSPEAASDHIKAFGHLLDAVQDRVGPA